MPGGNQRLAAGELNRRVEVQEATEAANEHGEPVPTWATTDRRWAKIEPLSGTEFVQAGAVVSGTVVLVTMRYFAGLTSKHRLKRGSRVFNIAGIIDPGDEHEQLQVTCQEEALES